jgi:hypothetical protein
LLTAGTILHNTETPLTVWFWAAYLIATDKGGVSALLLQRQAVGLRNSVDAAPQIPPGDGQPGARAVARRSAS